MNSRYLEDPVNLSRPMGWGGGGDKRQKPALKIIWPYVRQRNPLRKGFYGSGGKKEKKSLQLEAEGG